MVRQRTCLSSDVQTIYGINVQKEKETWVTGLKNTQNDN